MKGFKSTGRGPTKGFRFPSGAGFSGSTGKTQNISYTRRTPQRKEHKAAGGFVPHRPSPPVTKAPMGGGRVAAAPRPASRPMPAPRVTLPTRTGMIGRYAEGGSVKPPKSGGGRPYKQHSMIRKSFAEDARNSSIRRVLGSQVTESEMAQLDRTRVGGATSVDRIAPRVKKELGLARGGNPNRIKNLGKYAHGGKVTGNALTLRSEPTNELDAVSGGKTGLRPGYSRGGKTSGEKRMGYAKGGAVSKPEAKKIAQGVVGDHVRYPAPQGHKGLKAC